jgi:hypothetical protein
MAALLIKELPTDIHEWLKHEAARNRRSMTQQVIVLFEERMRRFRPVHFGHPTKLSEPLDDDFVRRARREGRP